MKEKIIIFLLDLLMWFEINALPWLKDNWFPIINTIILLFVLKVTTDSGLFGMATVIGLWLTALGGSVIWKLFKNGKL